MSPPATARARVSPPDSRGARSDDRQRDSVLEALRRGGPALWGGLVGALLLAGIRLSIDLWPYDAGADTDLSLRFAPPAAGSEWWTLPLGRDMYGRNLARVLLEGVRAFAGPGLVAAGVGTALGLGLALARPLPTGAERGGARIGGSPPGDAAAGIFRGGALPGEASATLALGSVPTLIWLLLASVASGQQPVGVALALAVARAPELTAALRARFHELERQGALEGARGQQLTVRRIRWIHLAELAGTPTLLRHAARLFVGMLLAEASLSYLGDFGVLEPTPSWGRLLRDLSPLLFRAEPGAAVWVALAPLTALILTTSAILSLGEGLARASERPRRRPTGQSRWTPATQATRTPLQPPPDLLAHQGSSPLPRRAASTLACPPVLVELRGLSLEAGGRSVLQDIELTVYAGEVLAVVGGSGAGKSLLLRALLGRLPPGLRQSGQVVGDSGLRMRWVSQDALSGFDPGRTVGEHLRDALHHAGQAGDASQVGIWLERTGLSPELAHCRASQLSGGSARRAALAWSLAGHPQLLLADEPTTGVDGPRLLELLELIQQVRSQGVALVLVTHDLRLAARVADRLAVLHEGRLVEEGPVRQLLDAPAHPYTRRLVASARALETGSAPDGPAGEEVRDRARGHASISLSGRAKQPAEPSPPGLSLEAVSYAFSSVGRPVLAGLDWQLEPGERVGLIGSNGAGKTTLARILAGLLPPDNGTVRLNGRDLWNGSDRQRLQARAGIQLVSQEPRSAAHPGLTVEEALWETVRTHLEPDRPSGWHAARVEQSLAAAGLTHRAGAFPGELSGGELRRLGVARALLASPRLLILDEPTAGLDAVFKALLVRQLLEQLPPTTIVVWISHDLEVLRCTCQRIAVLHAGQRVEMLNAENLRSERSCHPATRQLLEAWEALSL